MNAGSIRPDGRRRRALLLIALAALAPGRLLASEELWHALAAGGHVLLIRHATAPGTGDPAEFRLGDCSTQRNLSAAGRAEARRLGEALRQRAVPIGAVLSSEWCRCRDTAAAAFGTYEAWPALNSFFSDRTHEAERTRALLARARQVKPGTNLVLVTHQVNITAATGVFPAQAEIIVTRPAAGRLEVVGRLQAGR